MANYAKWIIGTGSGRCGSSSLAHLLDQQDRITVSHERFGPFDYQDRSFARRLSGLMCGAYYNGDVASQWIWHARYWLKKDVGLTQMICLKRDREATIDSFMRWTGPHDYDHWSQGPRTDNVWDKAFPTYETTDKREALEKYYKHYYTWAMWLERRHDNFRIFESPRVLNDPDYQREMLYFAGVPKEQETITVGIHKNQGPRVAA